MLTKSPVERSVRPEYGAVMSGGTRAGRKTEPTYQGLIEPIRTPPSVTPDETGWKAGGRLCWLWAFVSEEVTVYSIQPARGFEQATMVLPTDYAGGAPWEHGLPPRAELANDTREPSKLSSEK
jgi:hypothetical protein